MLIRKLFYLRQVQKQQWMKYDELKKLQDKKLRETIKHAYQYVPFYRRKWKEMGVSPDDIKTSEDLNKLPIITRSEIKQNREDFLSTNFKKSSLHHESTSGSSGSQLHVYFDHKSHDYLEAIYLRALMAVGYRPWNKLAYVWFPPFKPIRFYEYIGIMKKYYILSTEDEETQLKKLLEINPEVIYIFPSTLFLITRLIRERKIESIKPKLIISHAELLTSEHRKLFEETFGCKVYDQYGTTEFNRMGWECVLRAGFHSDMDSVKIEIVEGGEALQPGEQGRVVVTGIVNKAMPLIRYDLRDIGSFHKDNCECGRGLPLMKIVEGRDDDFITLPSGRMVGPREMMNSLYEILRTNEEIFKIKINQEKRDKIRVDVVKGNKFSKNTEEKIKNIMSNVFLEPMDIRIKIVDDIKKSPHGKLRAVESEVKHKLIGG